MGRLRRRAPGRDIGLVLQMPEIGLNAAPGEVAGRLDARGEVKDDLRLNARAMGAEINIDKHAQACSAPHGSGLQPVDLGNGVGDHADPRAAPGQVRQARRAPRRRRRGHQHVRDARLQEGFRLSDCLTAQADGAQGELFQADRRALVHLAMRAKGDVGGVAGRLHRREVAIQHGSPDHQHRRRRRPEGPQGAEAIFGHGSLQ